ncbi:MAG: hypothetical protein RIT12_191 [Actinomycetota bacterium]
MSSTMETQELGVIPSFTVTLMVRRFDPETDAEPKWQDFDVTMFGTDRVLRCLWF